MGTILDYARGSVQARSGRLNQVTLVIGAPITRVNGYRVVDENRLISTVRESLLVAFMGIQSQRCWTPIIELQ
jgi:hypothetical protein